MPQQIRHSQNAINHFFCDLAPWSAARVHRLVGIVPKSRTPLGKSARRDNAPAPIGDRVGLWPPSLAHHLVPLRHSIGRCTNRCSRRSPNRYRGDRPLLGNRKSLQDSIYPRRPGVVANSTGAGPLRRHRFIRSTSVPLWGICPPDKFNGSNIDRNTLARVMPRMRLSQLLHTRRQFLWFARPTTDDLWQLSRDPIAECR